MPSLQIYRIAVVPMRLGAGANSSVVNRTKLDNTMDLITGFGWNPVCFEPGYPRCGAPEAEMRQKVVNLAKKRDRVLLYSGLDGISESEGLDRPNVKLPGSQVLLLKAVSEANANVSVVMSAGFAIEMPWLDQCNIDQQVGWDLLAFIVITFIVNSINCIFVNKIVFPSEGAGK